MKRNVIIFFTILTGYIALAGCSDENAACTSGYKLHFSQDSVVFDTVFSTIGSATANFRIYNRSPKTLTITSAALANGNTSGFHMIIDGSSSTNNQLSDISIRAHDSLFVFVSVTVNPTLQNSPVLIKDSIQFFTNGYRQNVKLTAYGQDVEIFRNKTIHNDTALTAAKPYLIYGNLAVDNGKTLTINPGARLYFHKDASLKIYGNLKAEGTRQARITFRGDRLDNLFDNVPYSYLSGQWGGLQILGSQSTATLNYATLMSGSNGILIPNGTPNQMPVITINNSKIQNFDSCGISARNANLTILNSEVSNCRSGCLAFTGGTYSLTHNTIANYYNDQYTGKRRTSDAAVALFNGKPNGQNTDPAPLQAQFTNCIVTGSMQNELLVSDTTRNILLRYTLDHCYLMSPPRTSASFRNILWGTSKDQLFIKTSISDKGYCDFRPTENAPIRRKADSQVSMQSLFRFDMNGIYRLVDNTPDIGAYQWQGE